MQSRFIRCGLVLGCAAACFITGFAQEEAPVADSDTLQTDLVEETGQRLVQLDVVLQVLHDQMHFLLAADGRLDPDGQLGLGIGPNLRLNASIDDTEPNGRSSIDRLLTQRFRILFALDTTRTLPFRGDMRAGWLTSGGVVA